MAAVVSLFCWWLLRVLVLTGGCCRYGEDERLTEEYSKELWDEGFD